MARMACAAGPTPPLRRPCACQAAQDEPDEPTTIEIDDDPDLHIPSPVFSKAKIRTAFSTQGAPPPDGSLPLGTAGEPGAFWRVRQTPPPHPPGCSPLPSDSQTGAVAGHPHDPETCMRSRARALETPQRAHGARLLACSRLKLGRAAHGSCSRFPQPRSSAAPARVPAVPAQRVHHSAMGPGADAVVDRQQVAVRVQVRVVAPPRRDGTRTFPAPTRPSLNRPAPPPCPHAGRWAARCGGAWISWTSGRPGWSRSCCGRTPS